VKCHCLLCNESEDRARGTQIQIHYFSSCYLIGKLMLYAVLCHDSMLLSVQGLVQQLFVTNQLTLRPLVIVSNFVQ